MSMQKLKEYGTFLMYCDYRKAYLYMLNDRIYKVNGAGIDTI